MWLPGPRLGHVGAPWNMLGQWFEKTENWDTTWKEKNKISKDYLLGFCPKEVSLQCIALRNDCKNNFGLQEGLIYYSLTLFAIIICVLIWSTSILEVLHKCIFNICFSCKYSLNKKCNNNVYWKWICFSLWGKWKIHLNILSAFIEAFGKTFISNHIKSIFGINPCLL